MPETTYWVRVARVDEVAEGQIHPIEVNDEQLVLTRLNGELHALAGICTHEYAELSDGEIEEETIWCPLHSSGFNLRTGAVTNLPAVLPVSVFEVMVEGGDIFVSEHPKDVA